jgi:hypothetical protein
LYEESVTTALSKIAAHVPADLVQQFSEMSGILPGDIHPIRRTPPGTVSAVDGSNAMVLDGGTVAFAAIRAGRTTFAANERVGRAVTPLTVVTIGPGHRNEDFDRLYGECFGALPRKGLDNADPERASAVLRDTLEYWAAQQTAASLPEGSLLLLDGTLRVSSQNHEPVLADIVRIAMERRLLLAAVTKRTRATWGGGHPLLPAMRGLAAEYGVTGPWWVKVDPHLIDHTEYRQGRHGEIYVASLSGAVSRPLKLELPKGAGRDSVDETMSAISACSGDGRIPGYPYPLLDAHRMVAIGDELADQIRQDLRAGLAARGIRHRTFEDLFGDLHDEFERF